MSTSCLGKQSDDEAEKKCEDDKEDDNAGHRGRVEDTGGPSWD